MTPTYMFRLTIVMLFACATLFYSCQRNGGAKTPETTTVETTTTTPTTEPEPTNQQNVDTMPLLEPTAQPSHFVFLLLNNDDGTFGYEVTEYGKLVVSQPNIPGASGTTGFTKKEQAAAAASLVISKLEAGEIPPTISEKELKKILKN